MRKITDEEFDAALEKELPSLNRKARRAAEHQRKKMMHLMSYGKSKSYVNLGSASAVYSGPSAGAGQKSTGR